MRTGNAIGALVVTAALAGLAVEATTSFGPAPAAGPAGAAVDAIAAPAPTEATTVIQGFTFAAVRVARGGEVTWRNADGAPHTVVAADDSFASPVLEQAGTFRHRFEQAGAFAYVCTLHPAMQGVVEVVEIAPAAVAPTVAADPYRASGG